MAVKFEATDYKKITLDEMLDFIEANYRKQPWLRMSELEAILRVG